MTDSGAREAVKIDTDGVAYTVCILNRAITTVLGKGRAKSIAAALRADLTTYVASVVDAQVREEREAIQSWLVHRCDCGPPCERCTYCVVRRMIRQREAP